MELPVPRQCRSCHGVCVCDDWLTLVDNGVQVAFVVVCCFAIFVGILGIEVIKSVRHTRRIRRYVRRFSNSGAGLLLDVSHRPNAATRRQSIVTVAGDATRSAAAAVAGGGGSPLNDNPMHRRRQDRVSRLSIVSSTPLVSPAVATSLSGGPVGPPRPPPPTSSSPSSPDASAPGDALAFYASKRAVVARAHPPTGAVPRS